MALKLHTTLRGRFGSNTQLFMPFGSFGIVQNCLPDNYLMQRILTGRKEGPGICCSCCHEVVECQLLVTSSCFPVLNLDLISSVLYSCRRLAAHHLKLMQGGVHVGIRKSHVKPMYVMTILLLDQRSQLSLVEYMQIFKHLFI